MNIEKDLFKMQDRKYKSMQERIISNIDPSSIIGVRTPELRKYAKELIKSGSHLSFLEKLPHKYFDENQLHAFIISEIKSYDECVEYVNKFLPYVDNWATCDQMSPKIFKKNYSKLFDQIKTWINSKKPYTIRFGIGMLMQYYLGDDFKIEYLEMISKIRSKEYYVNMMIAWFFATALTKQYSYAIKFIEEDKLDIWTHNKAIQKAIESRCISQDKKDYLRSLKRK